MNFNPVDKVDELREKCMEWNVQVKTASDKGCAWLNRGNYCIVVENPYDEGRELTIEVEDNGNFVLSFITSCLVFGADEDDYYALCKCLSATFANMHCSASIYYFDYIRIDEAYIEREDVAKPYTELFSRVLQYDYVQTLMRARGGTVKYLFWNPKDDKTITIAKQ